MEMEWRRDSLGRSHRAPEANGVRPLRSPMRVRRHSRGGRLFPLFPPALQRDGIGNGRERDAQRAKQSLSLSSAIRVARRPAAEADSATRIRGGDDARALREQREERARPLQLSLGGLLLSAGPPSRSPPPARPRSAATVLPSSLSEFDYLSVTTECARARSSLVGGVGEKEEAGRGREQWRGRRRRRRRTVSAVAV